MRFFLVALTPAFLSQAVRVTRSASSGFAPVGASGCECKSDCYTVATDAFKCDRCKTSSGCGKWGVTGRWDYCVYPVIESFESQTYEQKMKYFWNKILENPRGWAQNETGRAVKLLTQSAATTFDNWMPELPAGRVKSIHITGSVCRIKFDVQSDKYTGILGRGSHQGFIRMGPAAGITEEGMGPGIGLKFPRTGVPAADLVSMHSVDTDQSFNFFASNMSNHIGPTDNRLLTGKFHQATICALQVGLSDFARYSQSGKEHTSPKFPYKLFYVPSKEAQTDDQVGTEEGLFSQIAKWPVGTPIFTVYACGSSSDHEDEPAVSLDRNCGSPTLLGTMKTTGKCTTSEYGDYKFFIRHQPIEEDWALEPEFKENGQLACGRSNKDWKAGSPEKCAGGMLTSDA